MFATKIRFMNSLFNFDRDQLNSLMQELGLPAYRANQLWGWIYKQGVSDFALMSSFSKSVRETLASSYSLARPTIQMHQKSTDGTQKWLLQLEDKNTVEAVFIPEEKRNTLCISSQVGCTLTCKFCHTGTQRLVRNLTAGEIVAQVLVAKDALGEWPTTDHNRQLTNIVLMGMGEPLYNYDEVAKALRIIMDPEGLSVSKRRITLSTSGVVPMIEKCGQELGVNLAISLHATNDDLRNVLVPLNKKYPLKELIQACRDYPLSRPSSRITFEYVMLHDVNDRPEDAKALVRLIKGIPAKINLIPFNSWPGAPYTCSTPKAIEAFAEIVMKAGYMAPVRTPRGQDILAACGQLKTASEKLKASERLKETPKAA